MANVETRRPEPLVQAFDRLTTGVSTLVRDHLELAKIELRQGVETATRDALVIGVGAGVLLVAHGLVMVACALALSRVMPDWLAFALVGAANLGAGGVLVARRVKLIRARTALADPPESAPPS